MHRGNRCIIHDANGEDNEKALVHADPFDVIAGTGVDFDDVAFFDEARDVELAPGFYLGRFGDVGGGIPFDTWLGLDDFQVNVGRGGDGDGVSIEENHGDRHSLLEVFPVIVDLIGRQFELIVRNDVHEDEGAGLVVQELGFDFFDVGDFQFVTTLESSVEDGVTDQVLQFALVEGISFAGFDEVDFGKEVWFAIDLDFEALFQVTGLVRCHGKLANEERE